MGKRRRRLLRAEAIARAIAARVQKERLRALSNTINRASVRNTAGLINVIVQVPIQIGSDSNNLVNSDDNAVSQGV
ncbi:hypothetical protein [Staphylospora marina]|uniref:hypothetical protein n=1 Tax=Staphylospora marina TaxID=2490858 RepID=UPI000F5BB981|nr:hypothetical protein [Staphylospora marina]